MKKIAKLFAALCVFAAAVSCADRLSVNDEIQGEGLIPFVIEAQVADTKATVSGLEVLWQAGDKIAVFDGTAKREFTLTSGAGTKTARFEGEIAAAATKISAVAPYSAAGDEAGEYNVPTFQQLSSSTTIDPAAVVMVAAEVAKDATLAFKNPCGVARLTVPAGTDYASVGGPAGLYTVKFPEALSAAGDYDLVLPAGEHGDIIAVTTIEGVDYVKTTNNSLEITAGSIIKLGDIKGEPGTLIKNAAELKSYLEGWPKLNAFVMNNLDLTGVELVDSATVSGVFNGCGHSLKNWKPAPLETSRTGALVQLNKGIVKNIVLDESCTFKMIAKGNNSFVVLENQGIVSNCVNNADIQIVDFTGTSNAGAIVAKQTDETAKTIDCYNNGNFVTPEGGVTVGGQMLWGGVIGRLDKGQVIDCVNNGEIVVNAKGLTAIYYLGGVVGFFDNQTSAYAAVEGCSNTGTVKLVGTVGKPVNLGGVVGASKANAVGSAVNYGLVKNCFNSGNVIIDVVVPTGGSSYSNVGGVVGYLEGDIEGCYATETSYVANLHNNPTSSNAAVRTAPSAGGVVGRLVFSGKNCSNAGKVELQGYYAAGTGNKAFVGSSEAPVIGGVFGCAGKSGAILTGCANTSSEIIADVKMGPTNATSLYIGGVAGASYSATSFCSNSADLTLDKCEQQAARFGGVIGYLVGAASECVNDGKLTIEGLLDVSKACSANSAKQFYLGGIAGNQAGAISNSVNNGRIYFKQARNANAFSYIGGISGTSSANVTDCTNNGEVASSSASNIRLAGICGTNTATIKDCVNAGQLTVENATADAEKYRSAIAGIVGHSGGNITSNVNSGDITCTNCADSICVALLAGTVGNTSKEWNGNTTNGAITAPNCKTIGYLLGGHITLNSATTAVAVKVGNVTPNKLSVLASINGVEATVADCTDISKLAGYLQSGYESCFILSEGGVTFTDPVLAYAGDTYKIVKLKDGKWWMAENLRFVPKGYTPSDDLKNVTAGVYYPVAVDSLTALFSKDSAVIKTKGYLYQSEVALGLKVGDITSETQAKALEGCQGICPVGWHIPTITEIVGLVGKAISPIATVSTAPYYNGSNGSIKLLNADGFNVAADGAVSIGDNTKTVATLTGALKSYPNKTTSGFICGSSFAGITYMSTSNPESGIKNIQFWGFLPMTNKDKEDDYTCNGTKLSYRIGASVRCVKNN